MPALIHTYIQKEKRNRRKRDKRRKKCWRDNNKTEDQGKQSNQFPGSGNTTKTDTMWGHWIWAPEKGKRASPCPIQCPGDLHGDYSS